jgi:hypothetical protein
MTALRRQGVADALAEPAIAAGDDGDLTFQVHVLSPGLILMDATA